MWVSGLMDGWIDGLMDRYSGRGEDKNEGRRFRKAGAGGGGGEILLHGVNLVRIHTLPYLTLPTALLYLILSYLTLPYLPNLPYRIMLLFVFLTMRCDAMRWKRFTNDEDIDKGYLFQGG